MVDAISTVNTTVEFLKLGESTGSDYTTDITNFTETSLNRNVSYKKIVGGLIIPKEETAISKDIEFDFVITDTKFEEFISGLESGSVEEWDTFDKYKISISFTAETNNYVRVFYNAVITESSVEVDDDILMGTIKFSLPMKNYSGNPNFYVYTALADKTKKDVLMGYD